MSRPDTWMPMYWGDYARDTGHLNAAGHGAYLMLIKHYWCSGEPLSNDDDELWRIACCDTKKEWLKLKQKVLRLFVQESGKLSHKRVNIELANAVKMVEQRSAAGRASAEARKRQQEANENQTLVEQSLNECPTSVDVAVDIPLPRNGRPSPSPSQSKKDSDLRSAAVPPNARDILWQQGLPIIRSLIGQSDSQARSFLGKMLKNSHNDCASVLRVILEAQSLRPVEPSAWLLNSSTPVAERGLLDQEPPQPSPSNPAGRIPSRMTGDPFA